MPRPPYLALLGLVATALLVSVFLRRIRRGYELTAETRAEAIAERHALEAEAFADGFERAFLGAPKQCDQTVELRGGCAGDCLLFRDREVVADERFAARLNEFEITPDGDKPRTAQDVKGSGKREFVTVRWMSAGVPDPTAGDLDSPEPGWGPWFWGPSGAGCLGR